MTGMYQTTTGTHHMRSHRDDDYRLPEGVRPVTQRLKDAGYFTANISNIGDKLVATPESVPVPPYYPDHEITRQEIARFYNSVTGMDIRVGWILEELEVEGLADNTIVVFFGDNGRLDARGIHLCWDTGLRVPLIIR
jgi:arylsulfatase A-like enzyme